MRRHAPLAAASAVLVLLGVALWLLLARDDSDERPALATLRDASAPAMDLATGTLAEDPTTSPLTPPTPLVAPDGVAVGVASATVPVGSALIVGRCVDGAGAPVSDVELRFGMYTNDRRLDEPGVLSDLDGRFAITADVAWARHNGTEHGFLVAWPKTTQALLVHHTLSLLEDEIDVGDRVLAPGAAVVGRAVDAAGRPLAGVRANVRSVRPDTPGAIVSGVPVEAYEDEHVLQRVLSVTSDAEGRFVLPGLPAGRVDLALARDDLLPLELPGRRIDPPRDTDLGDVIFDEGGVIAGRVVDELGQPVADAHVSSMLREGGTQPRHRARDDDPVDPSEVRARPREIATATTDAEGRFALRGLDDGRYEVSAVAPGRAWVHVAHVAPGTLGLVLQLQASGELQLDVRDRVTGEPVRDVHAKVSITQEYGRHITVFGWLYAVRVDDDDSPTPGLVHVTGVGEEGAVVTLEADGYGTAHLATGPIAPRTLVTRTVLLDPGLHLAGRVVDELDRGLPGVQLSLTPVTEQRLRDRTTESDADGAFRFDDVAPGEVDLRAYGAGLLDGQSRLTLESSRDDVAIRLLRAARLTGRVLDEAGEPAPGVLAIAWPASPATAFTHSPPEAGKDVVSSRRNPVPSQVAGDDGSYLLEEMVPGTYLLFATRALELPTNLQRMRWNAQDYSPPADAVRVVVPGGSLVTRDVRLPRGTQVTGRVTHAGRPAVGASVDVLLDIGENYLVSTASTVCDAEGHYLLSGLPADALVLVARLGGDALPAARRLDLLDGGKSTIDIDVPEGLVRGQVVLQGSREPVAGVSVAVRSDARPTEVWKHTAGLDEELLRRIPSELSPALCIVTSDAEGRFAVAGLPPGNAYVHAWGAGVLRSDLGWRKLPADEPLEVTLEVVRGAVVTAVLRLRDGSAVDDFLYTLQLVDASGGGTIAYPHDARCRFDALEGGAYVVRVLDADDEEVEFAHAKVTVAFGHEKEVELLLDP